MFNYLLKNLSILKKFLFINLIFFSIIGLFTFLYLKNVQPNLIKKKSSNHIEVINNTIDNLTRLDIKFVEELIDLLELKDYGQKSDMSFDQQLVDSQVVIAYNSIRNYINCIDYY